MVNLPSGTKRVYVSFSAEINANTTESLIAVMTSCASQGVEEVYLLLSTPGGTVMNGINLYNILRGMPFKVVTHNVGNVDSIGNAVFLAGEERYASPHSTFMFHGVGFDSRQGERLEEKILRERLVPTIGKERYNQPLVVSLSNHERLTLRQAQGERDWVRLRDADL